MVAQANGMKKKNGGTLSMDDFLPEYVRRKQKKVDPVTRENQIKSKLMALAARSKKKDGK
jgi:hypothetical protein